MWINREEYIKLVLNNQVKKDDQSKLMQEWHGLRASSKRMNEAVDYAISRIAGGRIELMFVMGLIGREEQLRELAFRANEMLSSQERRLNELMPKKPTIEERVSAIEKSLNLNNPTP